MGETEVDMGYTCGHLFGHLGEQTAQLMLMVCRGYPYMDMECTKKMYQFLKSSVMHTLFSIEI